jgi:DnaJ family protein C protein 28
MSLSEREQRQQRGQLERARSKLDERRLPRREQDEYEQPRREKGWGDLVEQRIQEAMAAGTFDNLPGAGKPLNLDRNPYLDGSLELAYGLLKNNGYAPEWIARDKEIRQELEAARTHLRVAWKGRQADPADDSSWQAAVTRFEKVLAQLNQKIDNLNLIVPISSCQRLRLRLEEELHRLENEPA